MTDFGISRDWSGHDRDTTQGPTYKTLRYCAPEVAIGEAKNSSSDIWSLGCVFLEIWTVLNGRTTSDLSTYMETTASESRSYYANSEAIRTWCEILVGSCGIEDKRSLCWISSMLQVESTKRCSAQSLSCDIREVDEDPEVSYSFTGRCCTEDDDGAQSVVSSDYDLALTDVVAEAFTTDKTPDFLPALEVETRSNSYHGPSSPQVSMESRRNLYENSSGESHHLKNSLSVIDVSQTLYNEEHPSTSAPSPQSPSWELSQGFTLFMIPQSTFEQTMVGDETLEVVDSPIHHEVINESAKEIPVLLHNGIAMPENQGSLTTDLPRPPIIHEAPTLKGVQLRDTMLRTTNGRICAFLFGKALNLDLRDVANLPTKINMNSEECKYLRRLLMKEGNPLHNFLLDDRGLEERLDHIQPLLISAGEVQSSESYIELRFPSFRAARIGKVLDQLGVAYFTLHNGIECSYPFELYQRCERRTKGWRKETRLRSLLDHILDARNDVLAVWRQDLSDVSDTWEDSWARGKIIFDINFHKHVEYDIHYLCLVAISGSQFKEVKRMSELIQLMLDIATLWAPTTPDFIISA
jgi:hypothetical protein